MFCPNCGAPIQSGGNFCTQCKRMIEEKNLTYTESQKNCYIKTKSTKKATVIISMSAVAFILFSFIISIVAKNTPEKAAERFVTGMYTNNYIAVKNCSICDPKLIYGEMTDSLLHNYDFMVTALSLTSVDEDNISDIKNYFNRNEYLGVDSDGIWDVCMVRVKVIEFQKNISNVLDEDTYDIYVAKYKGSWKVLPWM